MKTYKRYSMALNNDEDIKLQKVKNHYKDTGVKKIFMGMVNAMFNKIPIEKLLPPNSLHEMMEETE